MMSCAPDAPLPEEETAQASLIQSEAPSSVQPTQREEQAQASLPADEREGAPVATTSEVTIVGDPKGNRDVRAAGNDTGTQLEQGTEEDPVVAGCAGGGCYLNIRESKLQRLQEQAKLNRALQTLSNIAGGIFGAIGYALGGDEGSDVGAVADYAATGVKATGGGKKHPAKPTAQKPVPAQSLGPAPKAPPIPTGGVRAPASRHSAGRVNQGTVAREKNTVIAKGTDVAGDVTAINSGLGRRFIAANGENSVTVNGRTYAIEANGTLSPRSGPGFVSLDRGAFKALGILNKFGDTPKANEIMDRQGFSAAQRVAARSAWSQSR